MNKITNITALFLFLSAQMFAEKPNLSPVEISDGYWTIDVDRTRAFLDSQKRSEPDHWADDFEALVKAGLPVWSVANRLITHKRGEFSDITGLYYKILTDREENHYLATSSSSGQPLGIVVGKIIEHSDKHINVGVQQSWKQEISDDFEFILFLRQLEERNVHEPDGGINSESLRSSP